MRRFFFDIKDRQGDIVLLPIQESHHLVKVLRLQVGDKVELLDGLGGVYEAVIEELGRKVKLGIQALVHQEEDLRKLRVYQGILKGEKMDTVVQKCTELGVTSMLAYQSSRCQGKLSGQQSKKKHERWQRIGLNACKQCLRIKPMGQDLPRPYGEMLMEISPSAEKLRLLFWEEEEEMHLYDIPDLAMAQSIELLLGPEGGLTALEVERAKEKGFITVSLGKRILRAETATLTAISIVQYLSGNF